MALRDAFHLTLHLIYLYSFQCFCYGIFSIFVFFHILVSFYRLNKVLRQDWID